ncbi:MAG: HAD family phosphatase [Firmicutes bacterium]|nr:HAD family phosphatase [Bacillota bacterium]
MNYAFPEGLKAAIFDMDGTVLDSMGMWPEVDRIFLENHGLVYTPDYNAAVKTMHYPEAARYTIDRYGLRLTPEEVMKEWDDLALFEYEGRIGPKPFVAEYLEALRRNHIKTALATVSPEPYYKAGLESNHLMHLFDLTTDLSPVTRGKHYPDLFLYVAKSLGCRPEECLVFEDSLHSLQGAKKGGFRLCAVYDRYSADQYADMLAICDYCLTDYREGTRPVDSDSGLL